MIPFDSEKITFFAKTDARGKNVPFGIKAKDRQRHMYIVGKTGMGKSTLLENMAVQDIQNGEGMAFIDPHGSAAEVLLDYVPEHRVNDVVYFAPFDLDNPISFNVMEDVGPDKRHLVVSGLMSTFKKIWVDAWSARMEYILTNALLVLIEYPDTTLLSVNRIFNDKAYRLKVVDYCTDAAVKSFWVDEFANYTERFAAEALPAIQNKIGQFTGNPLIRNIIGQPHSSFDFREMMDQKKIVIMNLSKGLIGETNANLLGSMLTTRIYLAAMSRADLPLAEMKKMPNFYFYVDEFQSFANATFANILSEARKYHLNLIIAHQYIEQMEEEVRDAVFGNVGTTVAFRVGPFDAETLETVFTPRFLAADLVNLGFAQIYLTLMIDGIGSQPFSAKTLTPIELPPVSCRDMVIAASRRNYTHPREEVEKIVTELHTPAKEEKKPAVTKTIAKPSTSTSTSASAPVSQPYEKKAIGATLVQTGPTGANVTNTVSEVTKNSTNERTNTVVVTTDTMVVVAAPVVPRVLPTTLAVVEEKTQGTTHRSRPMSTTENTARVTRSVPIRPSVVTPKPKTSVDDLRNVLARISKAAAEPEKVKTDTSGITKKTMTGAPLPAEAISPLKAALSALEKVDQSAPRVLPPRPVPVSSLPPLSPAERAEIEQMAKETEMAFAALETKQTAALPTPIISSDTAHTTKKATKSEIADPLSPKVVARMLRSSGTERSPFK